MRKNIGGIFACSGVTVAVCLAFRTARTYDRAAAVARDFYTGVVDLVRSSSEDVHTYVGGFFLHARSASQRP